MMLQTSHIKHYKYLAKKLSQVNCEDQTRELPDMGKLSPIRERGQEKRDKEGRCWKQQSITVNAGKVRPEPRLCLKIFKSAN